MRTGVRGAGDEWSASDVTWDRQPGAEWSVVLRSRDESEVSGVRWFFRESHGWQDDGVTGMQPVLVPGFE